MDLKFVICFTLVIVLQMTSVFSSRTRGRGNGGLFGFGAPRGNVVDPAEQIKQLKEQLALLQQQTNKMEEQKKETLKNVQATGDDVQGLFDANPLYNVADTTRDFTDGIHEANQQIFKPRFDRLLRTGSQSAIQPLSLLAKPFALDRLVTGGRDLFLKSASNIYDTACDAGRLGGHVAADVAENAGQYADDAFQGLQGLAETGQGLLDVGLQQSENLLNDDPKKGKAIEPAGKK